MQEIKPQDITLTQTEQVKEEKPKKKFNVLACNCCKATNITLIKATDSYYCKFCFDKLGKKKFQKKGKRKNG